MIIDAKTVVLTLVIIAVASYFGLQFIRSFALSIAQENHDANLATDMSIEAKRARREQEADAAAMAAFAKVEPLLPSSVVNKGMNLKANPQAAQPAQAPASGGLQNKHRPATERIDAGNKEEENLLASKSELKIDEESLEMQQNCETGLGGTSITRPTSAEDRTPDNDSQER